MRDAEAARDRADMDVAVEDVRRCLALAITAAGKSGHAAVSPPIRPAGKPLGMVADEMGYPSQSAEFRQWAGPRATSTAGRGQTLA